MKDIGPLKHFLGINFEQSEGEVKTTQKKHIEKMLEKFGMLECKPRPTPCEQKVDFDKEGDIIATGYREIVGSLICIMTCTKRDLSWAVSKQPQHLAEPRQQHWTAAKTPVLRYLMSTIDQELHYKKCGEALQLEGFSDADWAADKNDRRSTTGYCFSLNKNGSFIS